MNNKVEITFTAPPAFTQASNLAFQGSGIDELVMFANDIVVSGAGGNFITDSYYVPENLSDFAGSATVNEVATRQDIKRRLAPRLPRVTYGQGLVIWSSADNFSQYFLNSVLLETTNAGYIRVGVAGFTADQATNPFAPNEQGTLSALYSFFDISNA